MKRNSGTARLKQGSKGLMQHVPHKRRASRQRDDVLPISAGCVAGAGIRETNGATNGQTAQRQRVHRGRQRRSGKQSVLRGSREERAGQKGRQGLAQTGKIHDDCKERWREGISYRRMPCMYLVALFLPLPFARSLSVSLSLCPDVIGEQKQQQQWQ